MSPILVRPVREQLEHDRVIRLLQVRLKKRNDVAANIGSDQTVPVKIGTVQIYPDLVLTTADKAHKLIGTVEVETAESVNHLEAMAQWAHFGRARTPFHLYVPASAVDIARRLCLENDVSVSEIWSYHSLGDQTRFTLVAKTAQKPASRPAPVTAVGNEDGSRPNPKAAAGKPNDAGKTKAAAPARTAAKPKTRPKPVAKKKKRK